MTIRTRLTLFFTAVVAVLLLLFCLVIYVVAEQHRQREYRERLHEEAQTSAELMLGNNPIGPDLFKLLDQHQITVLNQEEIIIYNDHNQIVYESGTDYLAVDPAMLAQIRQADNTYWQVGEREVAGSRFLLNGRQYVAVASAVDKYGYSKQRNLALMLGIGWLLSMGLVFATGWVFAGQLLRPLQGVIRQIDAVTAAQLNQRLPEGPHDDELTQLARQFNQMLDRLEEAFQSQRTFVSNASHELRTPLTAITGQLDVALLANDDDPQELRAVIASVLDDVRGLNRMTNGLLSLAKLDLNEVTTPVVDLPIDKLLGQLKLDYQRLQPSYSVDIALETTAADADANWQVPANESLLRTALYNLMENGGKFSPDHRVSVRLTADDRSVRIDFTNGGPCIPADELPTVFKPFRRGTNARQVAGHGIGLSLAARIVRLHEGQLSVVSTAETGTTFTVTLPRRERPQSVLMHI
ncbi:HAMP domain-containing sensor histidine kinase [Fibrella aquatilis]|uniref:histidine kinase n=1 Tax=Fibrella aquatilis TaxID=2817059 RepID=A0A939G4N1_9BACT|nr:ATP-binding protein [Fibrella aquatilis]MBO0932292.1 HAMP domain-containing protein [Fibrella aquatilis]